jgi:hypothetical protein
MRRALMLVGLIGVGVLAGFVVRLIWPRHDGRTLETYAPPVPDV